RVINNEARVTPETRARVNLAISELGYRPNAIARSMARGRTFTLSAIVQNLTDYTFAAIIEGAEAECRRRGYFLLTSSAPDPHDVTARIEQLAWHRRVDGILIFDPSVHPDQLPENFPLVMITPPVPSSKIHSIALDNQACAELVTRHLLELGHTRIGHITGPATERAAIDRQTGFLNTLCRAGVTPCAAWLIEGDWSATSGYQGFQKLAETGEMPSAVFAQNDRMAIGLIRAAGDAGLCVPSDLSVIGFDDMPLASYFVPPLTTCPQNMGAIGAAAADLLIQAVENPSLPTQHVLLPPSALVIRASTTRFTEGGD
ncbi:MAG TPA: LacI family DNA-binding transcriptional regulator, partial [Levilinea sp.]|nr:LacI family DNA-binding transcriptional regulator [Levilinea sp.]